MAPLLMEHFERWDMEIHSRGLGSAKGSKSEVLFCAAPPRCYSDPVTFDGADLSDIQLPDGRSMPVVDKFCYLGSWITRYCGDALDVDSRLESAGKAFGALRNCVFRSNSVSFEAKRAVYERLVLSIGLFGCECWCLSEVLWRRLRCFHAQCLRAMCRVTRKHAWDHHISTQELGQRLGLESIDFYVARRQARWLGHVARMPFDRTPRKMLSAWVPSSRPTGCPSMTYGRSVEKSLSRLGIPRAGWAELAADRVAWYAAIGGKPPTRRADVPAAAATDTLCTAATATTTTTDATAADASATTADAPAATTDASAATADASPPPPPPPPPTATPPPSPPPPSVQRTRRGRAVVLPQRLRD